MKRSILITGATGKIGKVYVKYFLEKGDQVIALSRSKEKLDSLKSEFNLYRDNLKIITLDLMKKNFEDTLVQFLYDQNLKPNCVVNNARDISNYKLLDDGSVGEISFINEYKLGIIVPYKITMKLVKINLLNLRKIVNISSIYGLVSPNSNLYNSEKEISPIHYGVTKAALIQLTKDLAVRLARNNIQVNSIAYGGVKGRVDREFEKRYATLCPSKRMLSEDDLAGPLDLLLSEKSDGINGHVLVVDGGWTIW